MTEIARGWMVPHDAMDLEFAMVFHGDNDLVDPYGYLLRKKEQGALSEEEDRRLGELREALLFDMINALWGGELRAIASRPGELNKIEVPNDFWGRGVCVDLARNSVENARGIVLEALHIYDPLLEAHRTKEPPSLPLLIPATDAHGINGAQTSQRKRGPKPEIRTRVIAEMSDWLRSGGITMTQFAVEKEEALASHFAASRETVRKARQTVMSSFVGVSNSDK